MANVIIGRKNALYQLQRCKQEREGSLVVITGRRRVGKTYLINNAFNNSFDFKLTGDIDLTTEEQLDNFAKELRRHASFDFASPKNWPDAFELLRKYLSGLPKQKKKCIFFDEFPWLDTHKSRFLSAFTFFWNDFACTVENLLILVCGSASSWIEDKIVRNKGGLYNRQMKKIVLEPFTLAETEQYLAYRGVNWSYYDIASLYMILGGIPYYLKYIDPALSLGQNIDRLLFEKNAELKDEFDILFRTLFSSSSLYKSVVECLSKKPLGMSKDEISASLGVSSNGDLSRVLENLSITGFVAPLDLRNGRKRTVFRVSDYFTSFYLRFIQGNHGKDASFWSKSSDNPSVNAWKGFMFEWICLDHIDQIKSALGISGVISENYSWVKKGHDGSSGAQIDLVIKRRDRVTNLCEMKFVSGEFELSKDYYLRLQQKKEVYREATETKDTLQLTLVTTYGLKQSLYSNGITNVVTLEALFK